MNYLIAGLGNIGSEYENTRHNIGFKIVESIAEQNSEKFTLERHAYKSLVRYKGRNLHLIKPTTYMNLSGKSIQYWLQFLSINVENLLVLVDDKDLDFGKLRIRIKGSDGGHNGLKSIIESLGNNSFPRLRFGIGNNFNKGKQINYVLGEWNKEEASQLPIFIDKSIDAIKSFATIGIEKTMNQFNTN